MNSLLETTQRQLHLIAEKTDRLEGTLASEVATVRQLRRVRDECVAESELLQEQLRVAQQKAGEAVAVHDTATLQLKVTAAEYGKAQLLRKKYQNTVDELAGHCRTVVSISGAAEQNVFVVADEVTLSVPSRNKQFVVDAVLPMDDPSHGTPTPSVEEMLLGGTSCFSLQSMIGDVVGGTSSSVISFGPIGSGKTTLLFGDRATWHGSPQEAQLSHSRARSGSQPRFGRQPPPQPTQPPAATPVLQGLVPLFFRELLRSFESHDVTHFNMRLSFAELHHDAVYDLLGDFNQMGGGTHGKAHAPSTAVPVASLADVRLSPFQAAADAMELVRTGLCRLQSRRKSHVVVTAIIENFDARGHYRKATATFVDLAGCSSAALSGEANPAQQQGMVPTNPDQLWVDKSMLLLLESLQAVAVMHQQERSSAPSSLLTAVSRSQHHRQDYSYHPSQSAGMRSEPSSSGPGRSLLSLLDPLIGGANCKTTLLVSLNCADINRVVPNGATTSEQELLATLAQGFVFKSVINCPVPYDIPAEVQRLQDEMNDV